MDEYNIDETYTYLLFARPSFLGGVARIFDLSGSMQVYNVSRTAEEADANALGSDWRMIGKEIASAIGRYEQQEKSKCGKSTVAVPTDDCAIA